MKTSNWALEMVSKLVEKEVTVRFNYLPTFGMTGILKLDADKKRAWAYGLDLYEYENLFYIENNFDGKENYLFFPLESILSIDGNDIELDRI